MKPGNRKGFIGGIGTAVVSSILLSASEANASQEEIAVNTGGNTGFDFQMIDSFHPNLNATLVQLSADGYEIKAAFPFLIPNHASAPAGNGGGFTPNGYYLLLQRPRPVSG